MRRARKISDKFTTNKRNRIGDIYRIIRRILFYCRLVLLSSHTIDRSNKLKTNAFEDYFQYVLAIAQIAISGYKKLTENFNFRNPYQTFKLIQWTVGRFRMFAMVNEMKRKPDDFAKSFEKIKEIDETVELTDEKLRHFSAAVTGWFAFSAISFLVVFFAVSILDQSSIYQYLLNLIKFLVSTNYWPSILLFSTLLATCRIYMVYIRNSLLARESFQSGVGDKIVHVKNKFHPDGEETWTRIRELRKIYGQTHSLVTDLNNVFTNRIFTFVASVSFDLLYFTFYNITIIKYGKDHPEENNLAETVTSNLWILFQMIMFVKLVNESSKLEEESRKISKVLHDKFNETCDDRIRQELALFSLEILHRKFQITAKGLFNVDYSLLSSMMSGVIMHTIILLQFNFPGYGEGVNPISDLKSND